MVLPLVKYNNKSSIIVVENAKKSKWHVKTVYCNLRDEYTFLFKIFIIILILKVSLNRNWHKARDTARF